MSPAQVDAFLQSLIDFKGEDIAEDLVKRVQPYLDDPVFSYDKMKSKSAAAANLCNWVVNIITYNKVYKKIRPLMEDLLPLAVKAKASSRRRCLSEDYGAPAAIQSRLRRKS